MRFELYGSPHSLFTYKVALMLRLSGASFAFRYISFQKGMHREAGFLALSRWGQVPVLKDNGDVFLQSQAIVEHLAATLGCFQAAIARQRQDVREWLCWTSDVLTPPIFNSYGVVLGERKLLPITVDPAIARYHRERADRALGVLDGHLAGRDALVGDKLTVADLYCCGDIAFARLCDFPLDRYPHVGRWLARVEALPGFAAPFELLAMQDAQVSGALAEDEGTGRPPSD